MECKDYKIEVGVTPHGEDHALAPHYWILYGYYDSWCNDGNGWEKTASDAWNAAYQYYQLSKSLLS